MRVAVFRLKRPLWLVLAFRSLVLLLEAEVDEIFEAGRVLAERILEGTEVRTVILL